MRAFEHILKNQQSMPVWLKKLKPVRTKATFASARVDWRNWEEIGDAFDAACKKKSCENAFET